jgi:hypothetical protein
VTSIGTSRLPDRRYDGYVFDLDGTLYLGDDLIPGAAETVEQLRAGGARAIFPTSNPRRLPVAYADQLRGLGSAGHLPDQQPEPPPGRLRGQAARPRHPGRARGRRVINRCPRGLPP